MPSFTEPHDEKSGCISNRKGKPGCLEIHPELGTSTERFGYTGLKRKLRFLSSTARLCLTPPREEYFVAWQRKAVTLRRSKNTDPSGDQPIARPARRRRPFFALQRQ